MINPDWVYVAAAILVGPFVYYLVVHFENDLAWERSLREPDDANVPETTVDRETRRLEPIPNRTDAPELTPNRPRLVHSAHPTGRSHRQRSAA